MCNQENTQLILKSIIWFATRDYVTPKVKTSIVYVEVEDGPPRIERTSFLSASSTSNNNNNQFDNSLIGILLLAFGGAVISWIMPCVYPMIPIIISFSVKCQRKKCW